MIRKAINNASPAIVLKGSTFEEVPLPREGTSRVSQGANQIETSDLIAVFRMAAIPRLGAWLPFTSPNRFLFVAAKLICTNCEAGIPVISPPAEIGY